MTSITWGYVNTAVWGNLSISYKPISGGTGTRQLYQMFDNTNNNPMYVTQGTASDVYDIERGTTGNELDMWYDVGSNFPTYLNASSSTSVPTTGGGISDQVTATNKYLHFIAANGVHLGYMDAWTPFQSSGPTVTNISCSNQNSGTRTIDVTGSGTLTASDISYYINADDIQTLSSPNNGVHNIQTTSTGWTFDSYTSSKTGIHRIEIGSKSLSFDVHTLTHSDQSSLLTAYGINHTWPSDIGWTQIMQNYNVAFDSIYQSSSFVKFWGEIHDSGGTLEYYEHVVISKDYRSHSNPNYRGFMYTTVIHDYTPIPNGGSKVVTYDTQWIDPIAYHQANNDPEAQITVTNSAHLPNDIFTLKYATYTPPSAGSSNNNSGTPRDGYPIVMTNLFNRNRSIYSIGMTHKTARDPFL